MIASAVCRRARTRTPRAGLDNLPPHEVRAMWPLKPLRILPPGLPLLVTLAALAGLPGAAPAQPPQPPAPNPLQQQQQHLAGPADRVELLRRVVETYPTNDDQLFQ